MYILSKGCQEPVEVVRGPGSALHGADAFAGTINVITKDAHEINGNEAGVRAGSFGTTNTWAQYGGAHGGWDVALAIDFLRGDGDNERIVDKDLQTTLDAVLGTNASLAPGPLETDDQILDTHLTFLKDNWTARFWSWNQFNGGEGAGAAQILDPEGREKLWLFFGDLIYQRDDLAPDLDFSIGVTYKYFEQDNYLQVFPPGSYLPIGEDGNIDFNNPVGFTLFSDGVIGNPGGTENHYSVFLKGSFHGLADHAVQVGTGFHYMSVETFEEKNFGPGVLDGELFTPERDGSLTDVTGTSYIYMRDEDRANWYVLLQDEWAFARNWELTGGARYDHYSDFGGTVNPRLALVWDFRYDLTIKLLYGRAFRPPSFKESYFINNPLSIGNQNLDPEIIDTVELAFEYQPLARLLARCNLFSYEVDGLIDYVDDPGQTTRTAQNATDQEGRGVEVEVDWLILDNLMLRSNFAYQRAKDSTRGDIVADAPELQFYANLHWMFKPNWSVDAQYYWIGERHRASGDTREDVKDNDIVNLTLRRKNIAEHWDLALAARNLFAEDVREPSRSSIPNDYPMESRAFWGEVRYSF